MVWKVSWLWEDWMLGEDLPNMTLATHFNLLHDIFHTGDSFLWQPHHLDHLPMLLSFSSISQGHTFTPINLDNQSCGQSGWRGCPGTMWGPASAKLHTFHHVLAGHYHSTQEASMLVMDVLFGTRWRLRAKTRWRSTCLHLLVPFSIPSSGAGRAFLELHHQCQRDVPIPPLGLCVGAQLDAPKLPSCAHSYGVEVRVAAVNIPWGSALPAPSSVSLSHLRGLWAGFVFQAENSCVSHHRWKEHIKLPSPEKASPSLQTGVQLLDTSCLMRSVTLC